MAQILNNDDDFVVDISDEDVDSGDGPNYSPDSDSNCDNSDRDGSDDKGSDNDDSDNESQHPSSQINSVPSTSNQDLFPTEPSTSRQNLPQTPNPPSRRRDQSFIDRFTNIAWNDPVGRQQTFPFTGTTGNWERYSLLMK